jgi:hypothetical protein
MDHLGALDLDIACLRTRVFQLRFGLRGRGRIDSAVGQLLFEDGQCRSVSGHAVVEQLFLDVERTQREVIARQVGAHGEMDRLEIRFACLGVVVRIHHGVAYPPEQIRFPRSGETERIVGYGLAGERMTFHVLREARARLRGAGRYRGQKARVLVVDHRARLLQLRDRLLDGLIRYGQLVFEPVQFGGVEERPPVAARVRVARRCHGPARRRLHGASRRRVASRHGRLRDAVVGQGRARRQRARDAEGERLASECHGQSGHGPLP